MTLTSGQSPIAAARRVSVGAALLFIFMAAFVVLGSTRAVSNADWMVLAVSGKAEWRGAGDRIGGWRGLELNGRVPDGAEIRTGGDGHAVVAKGLDRIEIRPGTDLVVAARQSAKGALEIDQTAGSATYTVEKRPAGTFSVHTPYLVAVVKGTKFDVDITREETSVSVQEGMVGISDRRDGKSVDVTPGERATSSQSAPGIDVERTSASSATPAAPSPNANPNAAPNAGGTAADSPASGSGTSGSSGGDLGAAAGEIGGEAVNGAAEAVGGALDGVGDAVGGAAGGLGHDGSSGDSGSGGSGGGDSGGGGSGGGGSGGDDSGSGGSGGGDSGGGDSGGGASGGGGSGGGGLGGGGLGGGGLGGIGDKAGDAAGGLL